MRHANLREKFNKAQKHYEKGNYRRAKWLFEQIVLEIAVSDTDSMGDINLHNSAEDYLEKISKQKLSSLRIPILLGIIIIVLIILFTLFN
ncbi:MAG: hypothetical protein ACK5D5_05200 [Bacteroidota bacterium]|jgi:hypothetical protein